MIYIHFFTFFKYPKIFGDVYSLSIISQIFYKATGNLVWRIPQLEKGIFDARVGSDVGIYWDYSWIIRGDFSRVRGDFNLGRRITFHATPESSGHCD